MLIEFAVANFRSFHERQAISLVKAKGDELAETHTFRTVAANEFELLRSAAIYGPNAGGKSNLLRALRVMKHIVMESATNLQRGDKLPVTPFRLSPATLQAPSEFEVTFIVDGVRYQYGFAATAERIHEEWLFAYPKGRPQRWLGRAWDAQKQSYAWELGNHLTGEKQLWQRATRDNALFLSTAVHLNSRQLQPLYDWFNTTLRLANTVGWSPTYSAALCATAEKVAVMDFLRAADVGIDDIVVEAAPFDMKSLPSDIPESVKGIVAEAFKGKSLFDIKTVHKSTDGNDVAFDFAEESDGTKRLFAFSGPWIDSLDQGLVLFIDELNNSLHPALVRFLVQLFHSDETNPRNAQLIFTTHETSVLSQKVFRRDQIWFCAKDEHQATTVYPLTDFSPRKGRENLELAYLSGLYGALPSVRPLGERT